MFCYMSTGKKVLMQYWWQRNTESYFGIIKMIQLSITNDLTTACESANLKVQSPDRDIGILCIKLLKKISELMLCKSTFFKLI